MRIINAMFGKGLGGIEQAFVDYGRAMRMAGHTVLSVTHPDAAIIKTLEHHGLPFFTCANLGEWDFLAIHRLRKHLRTEKPDAVVCHGNRAIGLFTRAARGTCPVIGVAHNYNIRRFAKLDAGFSITRDLVEKLAESGLPRERIFHIPNMIESTSDAMFAPHPRHAPPVIGSMGRFVTKKGFDTYIEALALLKARDISFRAILGGDGEEKQALLQQAANAGLSEHIEFTGWVTDKDSFFGACDIFCLPSRHEPFGIVLLEAMRAGMPIVTTASEGPSEIVTHGREALVTPIGDAAALADTLAQLIESEALATQIARHGFIHVRAEYSMARAAERITYALEKIVSGDIGNDAQLHAA